MVVKNDNMSVHIQNIFVKVVSKFIERKEKKKEKKKREKKTRKHPFAGEKAKESLSCCVEQKSSATYGFVLLLVDISAKRKCNEKKIKNVNLNFV